MLKFAIPLFALMACGGGYKADSYSTSWFYGDLQFPGTRLTNGCLDIALRAQYGIQEDPILDISFGNRCVQPMRVDLRQLEIRGVFANSERRKLQILDPRDEMRRGLLGGNAAGMERLELVGGAGALQVCVSIANISAPPSEGPPQETCLPLVQRAT